MHTLHKRLLTIEFQSPKGRLQTKVIEDKPEVEVVFQSPKGRLQTFIERPELGTFLPFQSPKGRLQTIYINLVQNNTISFNPQRGGYKLI